MKLNLSTCILGLFMVFCTAAIGQNSASKGTVMQKLYAENTTTPFTAQEMQFLQEVYGEHLQEEILSKPTRVKDIKHLLRNRIDYVEYKDYNKDITLLSTVPLFNVFNKQLNRDNQFDKKTFNPLKYEMLFYTNKTQMYRIDNTDYYIIILQQIGL